MVLPSGRVHASIVDWHPVTAMSLGVCRVDSAGCGRVLRSPVPVVIRRCALVCRLMVGSANGLWMPSRCQPYRRFADKRVRNPELDGF